MLVFVSPARVLSPWDLDSGRAPGHLRPSLAWATAPAGPRTNGSPPPRPVCQALTAEIVKTIRDIIALNPLYRLVSGPPLPSECTANRPPSLGPGWGRLPLCAAGLVGSFLRASS